MAPSVVIFIADGTEEIEFVTAYDVLVRAGFEVKSIGVNLAGPHATCSRGVKITPDYPSVESTAAHTFVASADVLVLPGGARGAETFAVNNLVVAFVKAFMRSSHAPRKRWLAAICAATAVLVAAAPGGVGGGEDEPAFVPRVTSHPSVKGGIVDAGWAYGGQEERVVIDRNVITSRGPGTALAWALAIVEEVAGFDKRMEVQGPMMVAHVL